MLAAGLLALAIAMALPPLLAWQQMGERRALSLSNLRRIGTGALLYAQDWDGRPVPVAEKLPDGSWQTWPDSLRSYVGTTANFQNPANPTTEATHHPTVGYPVHASYALNHRLWNTFSRGPFPMENIELPEQTAMFVEAGPFWHSPKHPSSTDTTALALLDYGDMTDRVDGLCPYPSTHDGRLAVVAADGHGILLTVEHYPKKGRHDTLYGRIGGSLYNWNGGHPNGETDRPPHE